MMYFEFIDKISYCQFEIALVILCTFMYVTLNDRM